MNHLIESGRLHQLCGYFNFGHEIAERWGGLEKPWNPFRVRGGKSSRAAQATLFPQETKKTSHDLHCDFAITHRDVDTFLQCQSSTSCDMNMYYATPCKIAELRAHIDEVYMHYDSVCILQTNARP